MKEFNVGETMFKVTVSNGFDMKETVEDYVVYYTVTGSPSDIRKMMRIAKAGGRIPFQADPYILREGRRYGLSFNTEDNFFQVFRAS